MNYTKRAALLCCTCYIVLALLSFIPPQRVCGVELRRANVLSDIFTFSVDDIVEEVELVLDQAEYEVDFDQVELEVHSLEERDVEVGSSYSWHEAEEVTLEELPDIKESSRERFLPGVEVTPIEDYDTTEVSSLSRLYRKMLAGDSLVRIAVMGDSFVEADIITADLREALQTVFGGCGAGFAPMDSPLTRYRATINTESSGWSSYNVMQHRTTPEPYSSHFPISGWVSKPTADAQTTWSATSARKHLDSCQCVRLHFMAFNNCDVEVSINGGEGRIFNIEGGELLRQIEIRRQAISSVKMRVVRGAEGFIGYGALFEGDRGVSLDNYSVRSNNGQAMFWMAPAINAQVDKALGGYDLVVLQYGLNIMQSGVNKYTAYGEQVEKMIRYARQCFPHAAIMVMGVSDRSYKKNGVYQPMEEALALGSYQRAAAQAQGVCFWDTYSAMQAQGGMSEFVAQGWASKDFTHINHGGGRQIAWAIVDAIMDGAERERRYVIQRVEHEPIVDSLERLRIERQIDEFNLIRE